MATEHIVPLLIAERDKLNRAIEALGGAPTLPRRGGAKCARPLSPDYRIRNCCRVNPWEVSNRRTFECTPAEGSFKVLYLLTRETEGCALSFFGFDLDLSTVP